MRFKSTTLPYKPSENCQEELRVLNKNGRLLLGNVGFTKTGEISEIDTGDPRI